MFSSLQIRLWLTYALLIMLILIILGLALFVYAVRNPIIDRQAQQTLNTARKLVDRQLENRELNAGQRLALVRRVSENFSIRVMLYDPAGSLAFDSGPENAGIALPEGQAPAQDQGRLQDEDGNPWLYTSRKFPGGGTLLLTVPRTGGINLLRSQKLREVLRTDFFPLFTRAGLAAFVFAILLAAWMSHWIASPLREISRAAESVSQGNYQQIPPQGPDEVKALAESFNEMVARVQATQQSQRDFVANVSHELKTPLTSIQGFAQAIEDGTVRDQPGIQKAAGIILTEADRMYRLVVDLLDLARLDAGTADLDRKAVELEEMLSQVVKQFLPQAAESKIKLRLDVRDLPTFIGDRDRLAQVFTNLIDNAIKHTPAGGRILVEAGPDRSEVLIKVEDTGVGIPAGDLSRIFERFYQVDKSREKKELRGAGLGLAISKQIIEAHGGTISVSSEPGQGTIFLVRIPIVTSDDETIAVPQQEQKL